MVPAVSSPWLCAPADLPADIRPMTRWGLIVGVLLTHVIVAAVVVMTSRQEAVVADAAPISVSLLNETKSGELVPTAPAVVRPATPMPAPMAKAVPAPATPLPTPPVVAVAVPVQAQDMVVPAAPVVADNKATVETPVVPVAAVANVAAASSASEGAAQSASARPVQLSHTAVRYLKKVEPIYPKASLRLDESGHVVVLVMVDDHGMPVSASIKQSSGYPRLDNAAREAAMQSRYVPYTLNGVPMRFEVPAPFTFKPSSE